MPSLSREINMGLEKERERVGNVSSGRCKEEKNGRNVYTKLAFGGGG